MISVKYMKINNNYFTKTLHYCNESQTKIKATMSYSNNIFLIKNTSKKGIYKQITFNCKKIQCILAPI